MWRKLKENKLTQWCMEHMCFKNLCLWIVSRQSVLLLMPSTTSTASEFCTGCLSKAGIILRKTTLTYAYGRPCKTFKTPFCHVNLCFMYLYTSRCLDVWIHVQIPAPVCPQQDGNLSNASDHVIVVGAASKGIIQRDHQHNAVVYRSYYAANPFENMTEKELEEYQKGLNKQEGSVAWWLKYLLMELPHLASTSLRLVTIRKDELLSPEI